MHSENTSENITSPDLVTPTGASIFKPSATSFALGLLIGVAAFPGWVGNLLVFLIIVARGLLKKTSPVIYKLIASLAFSDFIQLSLSIFYLAPSSCLQSWLLPEHLIFIPGDIFLVNWYHMWFMFTLIALNRYVAVCHFNKYPTTFTHQRTTYSVLFSWVLAVATWTHFLWMPCCRFYVSFIVYSYMWEPKSATEINWGDYIVEWPGNVGSTIIMVLCYILVLKKMHQSSKNVAAAQSNQQEAQRRAKEARLSIQFLAISVVYILVWAMFRICPVLIGQSSLEAYVVVALLVVLNSSINPFVYLKYNEVLRKEFAVLIGKTNQVASMGPTHRPTHRPTPRSTPGGR